MSDRLLCAQLAHIYDHLTKTVDYAPNEPSTNADMDMSYYQPQSSHTATTFYDIAVTLEDFHAVTRNDRLGFDSAVGNYSSGTVNDNSSRLSSFCAVYKLSILVSSFSRNDIYRHTWSSKRRIALYCTLGSSPTPFGSIATQRLLPPQIIDWWWPRSHHIL
jgi:hypothetical protein